MQVKTNTNLFNALKPLKTIVSFMNIGAHPDDERSDLLAFLSRGLGVRTSAVIANRGEGGQNAIGSETGNALGVLRTAEMRKAAESLGIDTIHLSSTFNDPIYDHGFEKTAEATLRKWGFDTTYSRLILAIREHKPDIIMPCFPDDELEHGHHRAMTELTIKAFRDAADPHIYPEQLNNGSAVWQVRKLYLPADEKTATLSLQIGDADPATGLTYPQLGEQSRAYHRSQGMGEDIEAEPRTFHLELGDAVAHMADTDLFAGIPQDFKELAQSINSDSNLKEQLIQLQNVIESAMNAYPKREAVFTHLETTSMKISELSHLAEDSKLPADIKGDLLFRLAVKKQQVAKAAFIAAGITIKSNSESVIFSPGQKADLSVEITNNGPIGNLDVLTQLQTPKHWNAKTSSSFSTIPKGEKLIAEQVIIIPEIAQYHNPYEAPIITQSVQLFGNQTVFEIEIDDLRNAFILPELSITFDQEHIAINTNEPASPVTMKAVVKNFTNNIQEARLDVQLPANWNIEKNESITLAPFNEKNIEFTLNPPSTPVSEELEFKVTLITNEGKEWNATVQEIGHDHVAPEFYIKEAQIRATLFSLEKPAAIKIGYIDSGFDQVADHLSATGFNVTKLSAFDIMQENLTVYDTIVLGTRAYLSRNDLTEHHKRLMDYVKHGGHLVVQYHKPTDGFDHWVPGPYPFKLGTPSLRWRVADEKATIKLTNPASPLFSFPNRIKESDWADWTQERGLYFPMNWASQYETVLQVADQDETPMDSGILLANYGKGTYLYTNLIFHRQIQQQHPGAYRIFTNMLSYGKAIREEEQHGWIFKKSRKTIRTQKSVEASSR